jgi:hypothetical protein
VVPCCNPESQFWSGGVRQVSSLDLFRSYTQKELDNKSLGRISCTGKHLRLFRTIACSTCSTCSVVAGTSGWVTTSRTSLNLAGPHNTHGTVCKSRHIAGRGQRLFPEIQWQNSAPQRFGTAARTEGFVARSGRAPQGLPGTRRGRGRGGRGRYGWEDLPVSRRALGNEHICSEPLEHEGNP